MGFRTKEVEKGEERGKVEGKRREEKWREYLGGMEEMGVGEKWRKERKWRNRM